MKYKLCKMATFIIKQNMGLLVFCISPDKLKNKCSLSVLGQGLWSAFVACPSCPHGITEPPLQ